VFDDAHYARMADPETALIDVREAHAWVQRQLASNTDRNRDMPLTQQLQRLVAIAWRLKRQGA
jgi:hypothetical protein